MKCFIKKKLTPVVHFIFIPEGKKDATESCSRQLGFSCKWKIIQVYVLGRICKSFSGVLLGLEASIDFHNSQLTAVTKYLP